MPDQGEGALSRWSRLKRESKAEKTELADRKAGPGEVRAAAAAGAAEPEEVPVRIEDLPDIDLLTYQSDFTVFLREGVPDALHRLALAKLWRSDPLLANLDGLNDYDWDFTQGGLTDAIKALTPEQADKFAMGPREEVHPGRRSPQSDGRHETAYTRIPADAAEDEAPEDGPARQEPT
jgi:hypothetical protein